MELQVVGANALTVSETTFGREFNEALIHQVVVAYAAGARQGTRAQKTRAEVSGSGKKPWRQKGTGRARVLVQKLKDLAVEDALIITASLDENLFLAARNLYKVDVRDVQGIDPVSLIAFDKVIVTVDAVKQIEEILA